jgi:uncharacterized protein YdaU (DUF1376 family)
MHYFKRNIGDYHKKAGRLSMLEHGAYTLLMDACYDRERFPTMDEAMEWTWARSNEEIAAVKFVLSKFFTLVDGVYAQHRVQDEIDAYHNKSQKNKEIALAREAARRELRERIEHETCTDHHLTTNQEPLTTNQEPEEIKGSRDQQAEHVPCAEIFDAYAKALPELPQLKLKDEARKKAIRSLWRQSKKFQTVDFWDRYFTYVRGIPFLMGMRGIGFDWLMAPKNFKKVLEGNYQDA